MRNRILSFILVLLLAVSFVSCGKEDKRETNGPAEDSMEDMIETGKIKESDLSDNYRTDLVPIFKGSIIVSTKEDPNHGMSALGCYSKKSYKEVKEYYKKVMSQYYIRNEEETYETSLYEVPSYYVEAQIGEKIFAVVKVLNASEDPDKYFSEESGIPKNAKTIFSIQFFSYEE